MAATFDKETLIKHRFWILSGCFLLLVLIPLLLLGSSVSATVSKKEEEFSKQQKDLNDVKSPKNQVWVDELTKVDKVVEDKKTKVWDQAWKQQGVVETFPTELPRFAGKRFGDPIPALDADDFTKYYLNQLPELYELVQPLEGRRGIVQFAGGTGWQAWNGVVQLYREFKPGTPPTKDDIWLAQEDLWVKRELLRVIRDANDAVAIFKEVVDASAAAPAKKDAQPAASADAEKKETKAAAAPEPANNEAKPGPGAEPAKKETKPAPTPASFKTKPGIPAHKRFQNPFWELDLTLERNARGRYVVKGKITNISKRRQSLGVAFKVLLQDREDHPQPSFVPVQVNRDPLAAGESAALEEKLVPENLAIDGLYGVEQVLTWRTAPVKRLDRVELYWNSSHTANLSLKPPKWLAKSPEGGEAKDVNPVNQGGPEAGGLTNMGKRMGGGSFLALGGGQSGDGATTKNGLAINRYTDYTDQVRHMPVGLVVVADEDLIPYLLGAFANSRLRIQTTQCHWTHFRHKIAPSFEEETHKTPGGKSGDVLGSKFGPGLRGGAGAPPGGSGGYGPSRDAMEKMMTQRGTSPPPMMKQGGARGPGMMTPPGSGGPMGPSLMGPALGPSKATEEDEEDMNLVEVAVYGLASLYERYPPKPPATNEPTGEANKQ